MLASPIGRSPPDIVIVSDPVSRRYALVDGSSDAETTCRAARQALPAARRELAPLFTADHVGRDR